MADSSGNFAGRQDNYRGSSYPGFAGGSTNSAGDYVPAGNGINPQPPASSPLPSTGLKNQQPTQISNSLLQLAGPATSLGLQGGKALYNNWSSLFGSGTDPATGTALDASTAAATPSLAEGAFDGAPILSSVDSGAADSIFAGDPILSGAGSGLDSLGVAGGVADAAPTVSGGLLGSSVGGAGEGIASSVGEGAAADAVGSGVADTVGAGAADVGGEALGAGATDAVSAAAADTGIGDALASIGEAVAEVVACVICTELLHQGKISYDDRELDIFFINHYLSQTHYDGYIWWAPSYVKLMQIAGLRGKLFTAWAHLCFEGRQRDIKRKLGVSKNGSIFGRVVRLIGEPMCYFIGATRSIHQPTHAFAGD